MYVYFDANGTLKEIVSDKKFRVGDSKRDKIYVYWDGEHVPFSGWVKYRKPNGKEYPDSVEECFFQFGDNLVGKALPNKPLRNLKYFSYDHTYEENGETHVGYKFYEITIPDAVLNSSLGGEEVPTENNMVVARIRFVMDDNKNGKVDEADSIETLGALVFSVETNIGILTDSSINETQYNYLIQLVSMKLGTNTKSVKVSQLPSTGVAGTIYYVEKENGGIVYDAYFWNGSNFVYLGTTSYGLYTKQEGDEFEVAIQALWTAEMNDYEALINGEFETYKNSLNAQMIEWGNLIQSAASGSPKGVYSTLTALQNAFPTGTNGIYVVSENGHWYYWSGTAWTDGGVYLASVSDSELNISSTNSVQNKVVSKNIYDLLKSIEINNTTNIVDENTMFTTNGYLNTANGEMASTSVNFTTTPFIKVFNDKFISNVDIARICYYDNSYNFISGANDIYKNNIITIPDNTAFIKFSVRKSYLIGDFMLINSNILPSSYVGYLEIYKEEENPYYNKKMACLGDSMVNQERWQSKVVNALKLNSYSISGESGAAVCDTIYKAINTIDPNADFIILWCGTNDWRANKSLGNTNDIGDGANSTTFYGGWNYMLKYIAENFPSKKVLILTPFQRYNDYDRQYEQNYGYNSKGQIVNSLGLSLEDYVNAEILIANKFGYPVFNLYTDIDINRYNISTYSGDGIHMNTTNGADYFAKIITKAIKNKIIF